MQPQGVNINFSKGLDTKTDPWQVPIGNFLRLRNSVFTKGNLLSKRNGYDLLLEGPSNFSSSYLTTLNGNLTAIGNSIYAYSSGLKNWVQKGTIQPVRVSTLPLIRNNNNQIQCDSVIASNGLVCTVYTESINGSNVLSYKYVIADSTTGQNIVEPTLIPVNSGTVTGSARVFLLGNYFIVAFTNVISATSHLQYIAISVNNPQIVTANTDIAASYIPASTVSWDGVVVDNNLYIAYNTTSGSQSVKVIFLTSSLALSAAVSFAGSIATMMSLCADTTGANIQIYVSFYDSASSTGFTLSVDKNLSTIFNPVQIISSGTVLNLTTSAQNGSCSVFYEVSNAYSFASTVATNFINNVSVIPAPNTFHSVFSSGAGTITVSSAAGLLNGMTLVDNTTAANISAGTTFTVSGTTLTLSANTAGNSASSPGDSLSAILVTSPTTVLRDVGLASKAFIIDNVIYFLASHQSTYQNTYFLINPFNTINTGNSLSSSPAIVAKLAYENGGGYLALGLPNVTINGNVAQIPYLFKDLIEALSTNNNSVQNTAGGVYSQTGIELSTLTIGTQSIGTVEAAETLQISGGFGWMYDGYLPVEENFFLWPEVSAPLPTTVATLTSGITTGGSNSVTTTTSIAGIFPGMTITGPNIPNGQTITNTVAGSPNTITFSPGFATASGSSLSFVVQNPAASASLSTTTSSFTPTGTTTTGSNILTAVSSTANIGIGMSVTGTGIPANQFVTALTSNTITFGPLVATGNHTAVTITLTGNINVAQLYYYQYVYEWSDNNGKIYRSAPSLPYSIATSGTTTSNTIHVPTLRLTYKTANPVKIVVYRWSPATPIYFQITSVTQPTLNSTSVDSVTIIDAMSDPSQNIVGASILGNNIIYTTGGVVENVNSPATNVLSLFDTRGWKVDSEDPNLLWFSKQIIKGVPVEWSDLFTYYVAPNVGISGSTSDISATFPMDDKFIIFKGAGNSTDVICYINGTGPDNTGANSSYPASPIFITSSVSCNNQASIVLIPNGLMFQATNQEGIWLLDRDLKTHYIGEGVEEFNSSNVTSAVNVPGTTYVLFTLSTGETLMYDYYYGQWGTFFGVPAVSSCIYQGLHTFLSPNSGNIFQESPGSYLDGDNPVLLSFTTSWINLASLQGYERFREFLILAQYLSPHLLDIGVAYDYNPAILQRSIIHPDNFSSVVPSPFGIPVPSGAPYNKEQWRIHAKKQLCESFQLTISEIFDPSKGTVAGAGFTMSGLHAEIVVKKGKRPIPGRNAVG